jgi:glycosyltransferase involved in cell wall biosynthesis
MKLSIIIPAYKRQELLIRCLISLNKDVQGEGEYEVCVIDDGSGLDKDEIRAHAAPQYPLIWRSFPSEKGRSSARNEGIRSTSGGIIVFLDSDMEAREGFLRSHILSHRANPHTAVIGRIIWPKGGSFLRYIGSRGVMKLKAGENVPPWYFVTGNASIERSDLPDTTPFDETLPGWGGEDLDLGLKLHSNGVRFDYAPNAISYHNFNGTLREHIHRTTRYGELVLPTLINRYPKLADILYLHLLKSPLWRIAIRNMFFYPALWKAVLFDRVFIPDWWFNYLTFSAYARGWLKGIKK